MLLIAFVVVVRVVARVVVQEITPLDVEFLKKTRVPLSKAGSVRRTSVYDDDDEYDSPSSYDVHRAQQMQVQLVAISTLLWLDR